MVGRLSRLPGPWEGFSNALEQVWRRGTDERSRSRCEPNEILASAALALATPHAASHPSQGGLLTSSRQEKVKKRRCLSAKVTCRDDDRRRAFLRDKFTRLSSRLFASTSTTKKPRQHTHSPKHLPPMFDERMFDVKLRSVSSSSKCLCVNE